MKKALILGCSHAAGSEMGHAPGLVHKDVYAFEEYGRTRSYPVKVAQALGYNPINQGIPGGSNDAMFRIASEQLPTMTPDDIIIACWTGINRSEVWLNNEWVPVMPGDQDVKPPIREYKRHWTLLEASEEKAYLNKIKNILALNAIANIYNVKVINVQSFWPTPSVVLDNFVWPIGQENFFDFCLERKFPKTDWGHFFEDAHQEFANTIVAKIK